MAQPGDCAFRNHAGAGQGQAAGLARHIGVANFNIALLDQAIKLCPEPLVALQAEYHPYLDQAKLLNAVRQHGMAFIAYCPLGRGRLFSDPVLGEIAKARGKSIAQIALRWLMQQGVAAIPRSSNPQRIADNFKVFDFTLNDEEMARIAALKRAERPHRQPGRAGRPAGGTRPQSSLRNGLATLNWHTPARCCVRVCMSTGAVADPGAASGLAA